MCVGVCGGGGVLIYQIDGSSWEVIWRLLSGWSKPYKYSIPFFSIKLENLARDLAEKDVSSVCTSDGHRYCSPVIITIMYFVCAVLSKLEHIAYYMKANTKEKATLFLLWGVYIAVVLPFCCSYFAWQSNTAQGNNTANPQIVLQTSVQ